MSDGIFDRVVNLIKGASENFLKDLERDNPAAVYQSAIDGQEAQYHKLNSAMTALRVRRQGLDRQAEKLNADIQRLGQTAASYAGRDDARALEHLEQKARTEALLAALPAEMAEMDQQIADAQTNLQAVKARWQSLKQERDDALRQIAQQQSGRSSDSIPGLSGVASEDALARARENLDRMGIMASFDQAATTMRTSAETAKQKAQAELEALKKAVSNVSPPTFNELGGKKSLETAAGQATAPSATAPATGSMESPLEAPPRRSLDIPDPSEKPAAPDTIPRRTL